MKSLYQLDRRVRHSADKNLLNAPNIAELNEAHKSVYGKNAETPADLLAAQTILGLQTEGTVQKRTPGSLEQRKFLESLKQKGRKELVDLRFRNKQMDKAQEGVWLDSYMGEMINEGGKLPKEVYSYSDGKSVVETKIPIDALSAKALARQGVEPDAIHIMEDGKIRPVFYEYHAKGTPNEGKPQVKDGKFIVDAVLSQPITKEQFKLNLSKHTQTAKQRAQEMGAQPEKTTIKADDIKTKYNIKYD